MDRGKAICEELKKAEIHDVVWLPASEIHFLQNALLSDPSIRVTQVCREAEAVAICIGLHLGGKRGAIVMEDNGLIECGGALKWALGTDIPMLLLVGVLRYGLRQNPSHAFSRRKVYTEPFLDAFGINYDILDSDEAVSKVASACEEAWSVGKPVALLLSSADHYVPGT